MVTRVLAYLRESQRRPYVTRIFLI